MSTSRIYLCAIPRDVWDQSAITHGKHADIKHFVSDALRCEQRIAKGVNLENEYGRYTLCCQRIEQEVAGSRRIMLFKTLDDFHTALDGGRFPTLALPAEYLYMLGRLGDQTGPERLGASFFRPEQIRTHRVAFEAWATEQQVTVVHAVQHRQAFLRLVEAVGCGLVEIQCGFFAPPSETASGISILRSAQEITNEAYISIPEFGQTIIAREAFGPRKQRLAATLRTHIRAALTHREPVVFGNEAQHDVIAEVLNEFAFVPPSTPSQPAQLRIMYADGSEALPFPLFSMTRETTSSPEPVLPLRVALMSMRHLELDPEIDFCWFRNRDVSRTRTLAETDQFCFDTTITQLRESLALGDLVIHLYHTGFEPAVIGFYRGVIQVLHELRHRQTPNSLVVCPYYYRGGTNYEPGTLWR